VGGRRELLDVVDDPLHPHRHLGRVGIVAHGRQVHEDVRGGSVRCCLTEQGRDPDVARRVGVAPAGERLGRGDDGETRLERRHGHVGCPSRGRLHRGTSCLLLALRLPGQLPCGREGRVRLGILIGEIEEAGRELAPGRGRFGVELRVLRPAHPALGERGHHRHEGRSERSGHGRCAAPTGDGRARRQLIDEGRDGQVTKGSGAFRIGHDPIVGGDLGAGWRGGRLRHARALRTRQWGERGTGALAPAGSRRRAPQPRRSGRWFGRRQAARRSSSSAVIVQRRERC